MASGGKFYILLPNLPDTVRRLECLRREFDGSLLDEFHGLLAINLAWAEMSDGDFAAGKYGQVLTRLHTRLRRRKLRRLAAALQDENVWHPADVFARELFEGESICLACNRFPAKPPSDRENLQVIDICDQCHRQLELGKRLTTSKYVSFFKDRQGEIRCLGFSATVASKPLTGACLVMRLNDPDLNEATHLPATFRYLANYIPHELDGTPWAFEDIAAQRKLAEDENSQGLLGVLKADVDNLGQIFQEGLRRDEPDVGLDTVSRIAALSRQVDWFFSGWLEWLLSTKYTDCYTVYSGGDDLLIVGPRSRTLDLAREIQEAFTRYTGHPEITISAGIAVVKPKLPLAHTVRQADSALNKAKEEGRDRLCMFGEVAQWSALKHFDSIVKILQQNNPPSAFLYRLLQFARMWREFNPRNRDVQRDVRGLRFMPLLAETLARNVNRNRQAKLFNWGFSLLDFRMRDGRIESDLDHLSLAVQWVMLERRVL
jgi:CRISPR-associated protein Csm1